MFGVGPQELMIIGLLFLVVFGPGKLPSMARDAGRLLSESRRYVDELKSEIVSEDVKGEVKEARSAVEDIKSELVTGRERDGRGRKP